jgi:hypothetical protein
MLPQPSWLILGLLANFTRACTPAAFKQGTIAQGPIQLLGLFNQGLDTVAAEAPHSWQQATVAYTPSPLTPLSCNHIKSNSSANYWSVVADENELYADVAYQLHYPPLDAKQDRQISTNWSQATQLYLLASAANNHHCTSEDNSATLTLQVFARRSAATHPPTDPFIALGAITLPWNGYPQWFTQSKLVMPHC